jgi:hypothetical protein
MGRGTEKEGKLPPRVQRRALLASNRFYFYSQYQLNSRSPMKLKQTLNGAADRI